MQIENKSVSFIVETIMGECESIIAETENTIEELDSTTFVSFIDELYEIRSIAEHMQSLVLDFAEESDEYQSKCLLDEMSEESINLYQCIKYSLESFETDNESSINDEITCSFEFMRHSINTIRSLFV
jgi:hypothetical protein